MKIFVCIKQVPDTETKIKLNSDLTGIDSTGVKWVINPYDEYAVEEAVKLRDANPGSQAIAISLGPKQRVNDVLRTAMALGIDESIAINCSEAVDSFATARALAEVIKNEPDTKIILTGKLAIDDNAAAVSQMLAVFLNFPSSTVVSKVTFSSDKIIVERDTEGGSKEIIQMSNPAVIAANKGLNSPRYASLPGIMKAKKKIIREVEYASLGLEADCVKIKYTGFSLPAEKPPVKIISGELNNQVRDLVTLLRDEAKIL